MGTLAVALLGLGVPTLGQVLNGFSPGQGNWWPAYTHGSGMGAALVELTQLDSLGWLLGPAALLAAVHSLDALSTARMLRTSHGAEYHAQRELLGQGAANLACCMCGGVGVTATPALCLALANTGAQGRRRRWFYPLWALVALGLLWGVVSQLAVPVLGALVALAGWHMVQGNLHRLHFRWASPMPAPFSLHANAAVVWLMLLLVLFTSISPLWTVGIGVALTTALWVYQASGKLVFRQYSGMQRRSLEMRSPTNAQRLQALGQQVQVLEMEGDLFFGSVPLLREHLLAAYPTPANPDQDHHLVLDFSRLDQMDASGLSGLESVLQSLCDKQGIKVWLSYVSHHPSLAAQLPHSRVAQWVPASRWLPDTEAALEAIEDDLLADSAPEWQQPIYPKDQLTCPLQAADWQTFAAACQTVSLNKDETLYEPGQPADHVFWLVKGDVRLVLPPLAVHTDTSQNLPHTADPRRHRAKRLAVLNPGTWLGLDALLARKERKATAVAHQASELLQLDVAELNGWATTHPALAACLFSNLAAEAIERLEAVAGELVVVDA